MQENNLTRALDQMAYLSGNPIVPYTTALLQNPFQVSGQE